MFDPLPLKSLPIICMVRKVPLSLIARHLGHSYRVDQPSVPASHDRGDDAHRRVRGGSEGVFLGHAPMDKVGSCESRSKVGGHRPGTCCPGPRSDGEFAPLETWENFLSGQNIIVEGGVANRFR